MRQQSLSMATTWAMARREQICALARQLPTPPVRTQQTDADTREALYGALAREMAVDFTPIFIDAVDMANQTFTYRQGERLMQRSWSVEDGQIVLTDGAQDVQRQTTYTPVTQQQEDPPMATEAVKARVTALHHQYRNAMAGSRPAAARGDERGATRTI